ncbi:MAG: hypothetical protein LBK73_09670 [Treponema sp.]|nr:hypothetical protein [Treponema sp.]
MSRSTDNQRRQSAKNASISRIYNTPPPPRFSAMIVLKRAIFGRMKGKGRAKYGLSSASPGKRVIAAYARGERGVKTARRIRRLGTRCDQMATDNWSSFLPVFGEERREAGKRRAAAG